MYAKIPADRAVSLGIDKGRKVLQDGYILINEGDLFTFGNPEESFADKVIRLNGTALTNIEAKQELDKTKQS